MAAPRSWTVVIVLAVAACSGRPTLTPSPVTTATAEAPPASRPSPSSSPVPSPSSSPVPSPLASPSADVDPAAAFVIESPYELALPSAADRDQLSGNIQGLSSDLAVSAGAGYSPSDFPFGFRHIREADRSVGLLVVLAMPAEVAGTSGLLDPVAAAVAAEVNAVLSYETIGGVRVGVVRGPIASALAIVDGHLVMAQSGQPAVHPTDLMAAVIAAN